MPLIYRAVTKDGKEDYIGFTSGSLAAVVNQHRKDALRKIPRLLFERRIKALGGVDAFDWLVLFESHDYLRTRSRESYFIKALKPTLNKAAGGNAGPARKRHARPLLQPFVPIENETWRPVVGFEGHYEISDHGRIRSLRRIVKNPVTGVMIRPSGLMRISNARKYPSVSLCKDGKEYTRKISRLVAEAFIGPRPAGLGVLHRDDNKANNSPFNLYYGTAAENGRDKVRNGKSARGESHAKSVITEEQARKILRLDSQGIRQIEIIRLTGLTKNIVAQVRNRRTWRHIEEIY